MKSLLLLGGLAVLWSPAVFASACLPGTLETYVNLGSAGCELGNVLFANFAPEPGQTAATPIDPAQVQVAPGSAPFAPILLFELNASTGAGEILESFFRFDASGFPARASIALNSPSAAGDGAVTGVLNVCPDGMFAPDMPTGCTTSPAGTVVFAIDQSAFLSDSLTLPASGFFDVFVDLTIDGGLAGSASLASASVGVSSIPEPSALLLVAAGLGALGKLRARRIF